MSLYFKKNLKVSFFLDKFCAKFIYQLNFSKFFQINALFNKKYISLIKKKVKKYLKNF